MNLIMINRKLKLVFLLGSVSLLLTACSSRQSAPTESLSQNENKQKKNKTISMELARGKISQSAGMITVPVILKNTGTNSTVINSNNFTLKIKDQSFKPFTIKGEASDYHLDFSNNNTFNNTISFYLGSALTRQELKDVQLFYTMDNGNNIKAQVNNNATDQKYLTTNMTQNMKHIGEYYSDIIDYKKQLKQAEESDSDNLPALKDMFQDNEYDHFKMWVVLSKSDPNTIVIKVLNQSNTDVSIPFDNLEVVDKSNVETRIAPSYRNYYLVVPYGKYAMVSVPLQDKVDVKSEPLTTKVRKDNNSSDFFDTKKSIYPIETVVSSNSGDINELFTLNPSTYEKSQIDWSNPVLDIQKNEFKSTVEISDYFALVYSKKKFKLVGLNKDSTIGDIEVPNSVTPSRVTTSDPTQIVMKFKDLSLLKNYPHIVLKYSNNTIMKVK